MERGGYMCGRFRKHGMKRFMSSSQVLKSVRGRFYVLTLVWTKISFIETAIILYL
jgi:hypothetical protein